MNGNEREYLIPGISRGSRARSLAYVPSPMLNSVSNYFYERRGGLARFTGYSGVVYLVGTYVKERLEEVKDKVLLERKARDK